MKKKLPKNPLISFCFMLSIFVFSNPTLAQQCLAGKNVETSKKIWFCPEDTTIQEPRKLLAGKNSNEAQACSIKCRNQYSSGTASETPDRQLYANELIASFPSENKLWQEEFREQKYSSGEAYTTIRVDIEGRRPPQRSCSQYTVSESLFRTILGSKKVNTVTFSVVLTDFVYNRTRPTGKGIVVPVFSMSKTVDGNCDLNYHLDRDIAVAKVRADQTRNLRVTGVYSYSENRVELANFEQTVLNASVLGGLLNGKLGSYAPFVSEVFSSQGFQMALSENLSEGNSLPIFPRSNADARVFRVRLSNNDTLSIKVYQDTGVNPEGGLESADSLSEAVTTPETIAVGNDSGTQINYISIQGHLGETRQIDFLVPGKADTTIKGMRNFCNRLIEITTNNYGLSDRAQNKLLALAMREYKNPKEFYLTRDGRLACVTKRERGDYQNIILDGLSDDEVRELANEQKIQAEKGQIIIDSMQ
jgi:hypothetical protein